MNKAYLKEFRLADNAAITENNKQYRAYSKYISKLMKDPVVTSACCYRDMSLTGMNWDVLSKDAVSCRAGLVTYQRNALDNPLFNATEMLRSGDIVIAVPSTMDFQDVVVSDHVNSIPEDAGTLDIAKAYLEKFKATYKTVAFNPAVRMDLAYACNVNHRYIGGCVVGPMVVIGEDGIKEDQGSLDIRLYVDTAIGIQKLQLHCFVRGASVSKREFKNACSVMGAVYQHNTIVFDCYKTTLYSNILEREGYHHPNSTIEIKECDIISASFICAILAATIGKALSYIFGDKKLARILVDVKYFMYYDNIILTLPTYKIKNTPIARIFNPEDENGDRSYDLGRLVDIYGNFYHPYNLHLHY